MHIKRDLKNIEINFKAFTRNLNVLMKNYKYFWIKFKDFYLVSIHLFFLILIYEVLDKYVWNSSAKIFILF